MGEHGIIETAIFIIKDNLGNEQAVQLNEVKDFYLEQEVVDINDDMFMAFNANKISVSCSLTTNSKMKLMKAFGKKPNSKKRYKKNRKEYERV